MNVVMAFVLNGTWNYSNSNYAEINVETKIYTPCTLLQPDQSVVPYCTQPPTTQSPIGGLKDESDPHICADPGNPGFCPTGGVNATSGSGTVHTVVVSNSFPVTTEKLNYLVEFTEFVNCDGKCSASYGDPVLTNIFLTDPSTGLPINGITLTRDDGTQVPVNLPTLTVPSTITVNATSSAGAPVTYSATASDPFDPSPWVVCAPASGSTFPIGITTVNCTATPTSGNQSSASFNVDVLPSGDLLVTDGADSSILHFDASTGAPLGVFVTAGTGGLSDPRGVVFGPDGNFYVSSFATNSVLRFNGSTGAFIDTFVPPGSGGLSGPIGLAFGIDRSLYVVSSGQNAVLKFDGTNGSFVSTFASDGLTAPSDLTFGPEGDLYVASQGNGEVVRYSYSTGASVGIFVGPRSGGGLVAPTGLRFGADGNLDVVDGINGAVLKYSGGTGVFLGTFVTNAAGNLSSPFGLNFGPDGDLYVASFNTDSVQRFDSAGGALLSTFVTSGSGGLSQPRYLAFMPVPISGQNYALTVTKSGTGTGTVSSSPVGIACGATCSASYGAGTTVTLTATADPTSIFVGWTGACSGTGTCTLAINAVANVTATFKGAATTTLVSSANPALVNQSIAFTVSVTSQSGTATGTVSFLNGANTVATIPLVNGQATYNRSFGSAGSRSMTSVYSGDANNLGSNSSALTEAVLSSQAPTTTSLSASNASVLVGQSITFTATVNSAYPIPNGDMVQFKDATTSPAVVLATVPVSNRVAAFTTSTLTNGSHLIKAKYLGDVDFASSVSSNVTETVQRYPTTTVLTSSQNPSSFGQPVTLTATVTDTVGGPTPTGTVTFHKGSVVIGTAPLNSSGVAQFTTSTLPVGAHPMTASYAHDTYDAGSVSAVVNQTVN